MANSTINYNSELLRGLRAAEAEESKLAGSQYAALTALVAERDALRKERNALLAELTTEITVSAQRVANLIAERDEARRMFCHEIAESGKDYVTRTEHTVDDEANARNVAEAFDWNCFKEGGGA